MSGATNDLPKGWALATLAELLASLESGSRPRGGVRGIASGVPSIGGEHLRYDGGFDFSSIKYVPADFAASMIKGRIRPDDILIVKDGATTGKTAFAGSDFPYADAFVNEHVFICRPAPGLDPRFLFRYLMSKEGQDRILQNFKGSAQGGINQTFAPNTDIPLAPLLEQHRIVAKLEALLTKVDGCQQRLAKIPILLKRFRQSVLAAACSGRLTADWRATQATTPPAPVVSTRQEDLEFLDLPLTWVSGTLSDGCERIIDGNYGADYPKREEFVNSGIPFFTSAAIGQEGNIIEEQVKFISSQKHSVLRKAQTTVGDVIFTNRGARVGATAMLLDLRFSNSNIGPQVTRLAANPRVLFPRYLFLWMRSPFFLSAMQEKNGGSAMNFLNLTTTKALPIFLPPLPEQIEIVRRVEALFALADQLEARFAKAQTQVDKLTPSLLARAFRGQLVPQDPNDEPASVLLERIGNSSKKRIGEHA
jgi:type I restriction enzyme S subunit